MEVFGDIWTLLSKYEAIVIPTNGYVKKNGEAVMGRGLALQAKERFPNLAQYLGYMLSIKGNHVHIFADHNWKPFTNIFTFPVKPEFGPNGEPGWRMKADLVLIERSMQELITFLDELKFKRILFPRVGTGNGGLNWTDVKSVIEPYLDDRFTVVKWIQNG